MKSKTGIQDIGDPRWKRLRLQFLLPCFLCIPWFESFGRPADRLNALGAQVREIGGVITEVRIRGAELTADDYRMLGGITSLKSLNLGGKETALTDEHLAMLSGLVNLEGFQSDGALLSDEGFRHFAAFKNLRRISLFHPSRDRKDFTGAGLAHLKACPKLAQLTFAGATAGDEAFKAVGQITQLKEFRQWHNWETAEAIRHLEKLPNLTALKMGQRLAQWGVATKPSFDDATLEVIARMKSLRRLDLQEARLSYAGLARLKALPNLKELKVKWVATPPADVERLRKLLPDVKISWEELTPADEETYLVKKLRL
ncbi:MAG: hypothetical protein ACI9VS_002786 [Candidatus Binatia bacterium]|jgi:hypothetical protein